MPRFVPLLLVLLLLVPAWADDAPPKKMTEAERVVVLKKAEDLSKKLVALYQQGKPGEAMPAAREALALRESALGPDHLEVAASLAPTYVGKTAYLACKDRNPLDLTCDCRPPAAIWWKVGAGVGAAAGLYWLIDDDDEKPASPTTP